MRHYWPLVQSLGHAIDRLRAVEGPAYDEDYKVQEWHPELNPAQFDAACEHVRRLHVSLDKLGL